MEVKARNRNPVEQSVAATSTSNAADNIAQTYEEVTSMAYMDLTVKMISTPPIK
ncbi:hypothetical protein DPMN_025075 [Dreissena polymorpha]|uniref:Uncharacterized protein n=1 Tax=Dreissena polymorpha TaxID=45954 RepID=A0A9D4RCZ4_DREPO|nr:hypothetical protein DPMN_025075 [Dreissena polymorpha]